MKKKSPCPLQVFVHSIKHSFIKLCKQKQCCLPVLTRNPSLNTQSCIRRPLCSTLKFENLSISLQTVSKRNIMTNGQFYDHFRPFFVNYMNIFHKTEVQTVILRCLAGLNFTPVTCTSLKSNLRLRAHLANSQNNRDC